MLTFLQVKDFAIIEDLKVEFGDGLNVITGETGAGKSIVINALGTLMQQRVPPETIRAGAQQAEVTGCFEDSRGEHILRRIVSAQGRSRAFLNDSPVTLGTMEEAARGLVHVYGQHELHHLLEEESYIPIIDELLSLTGTRERLASAVQELRGVEKAIREHERDRENREKEIALLAFQVDELKREGPAEGEEEGLRERLKVLRDAEKIKGCLEAVRAGLYSGEQSAFGWAKEAAGLLRSFGHISEMEAMRLRVEALSYEMEEIARGIDTFERALADDPEEMARLDERLSRIWGLKRKYGTDAREMAEYKARAEERLGVLSSLSVETGELMEKRDRLGAEVSRLSGELALKRREGAASIERAVTAELGHLSMNGAVFAIAIGAKEAVDETGADAVDFLISTNPGQPLRPLRRVASGGELSRVMLALKTVIGGDRGMTMIFDEIDAGIGGRVADAVGKRLKDLAQQGQILCITHLPQIAAYGDRHYVVEKHQQSGKAFPSMRRLGEAERVEEMARMLGGATITEKGLARAEEMLRHAEKSEN